MDLNTVWFGLIAVLFVGFFVLEGFDFGVGTLLPVVAKTDDERRVVFNSIGPFWDGNEVWLVTAGGAMFAAFPHWYASLFSGFYLALVVLLLALIARGVAFEFRSKDESPAWRRLWDGALFVGSLVPALLWGVVVGNLVRGVPIDAQMNYAGTFFDLLNPLALLGGLTFVSLFALHGAVYLVLRTDGPVAERAGSWARALWLPTVVLVVCFVAGAYLFTDLFRQAIDVLPLAAVAAVALLAVGALLALGRAGWAFAATALTIVFATLMVFGGLYPRVFISSLDPAWSLTIYNASSSPYTLSVMTTIALIFLPVVLLYQGWTYWVFRQRVSGEHKLEY
ncbi:MAG: cytochrome d ubiquinol oxidase subunit II [Chloroflexota bacterium]